MDICGHLWTIFRVFSIVGQPSPYGFDPQWGPSGLSAPFPASLLLGAYPSFICGHLWTIFPVFPIVCQPSSYGFDPQWGPAALSAPFPAFLLLGSYPFFICVHLWTIFPSLLSPVAFSPDLGTLCGMGETA